MEMKNKIAELEIVQEIIANFQGGAEEAFSYWIGYKVFMEVASVFCWCAFLLVVWKIVMRIIDQCSKENKDEKFRKNLENACNYGSFFSESDRDAVIAYFKENQDEIRKKIAKWPL
jgi:hypothetical protein